MKVLSYFPALALCSVTSASSQTIAYKVALSKILPGELDYAKKYQLSTVRCSLPGFFTSLTLLGLMASVGRCSGVQVVKDQ